LRAFVLDASTTVSWCFEDEANSESEQLLDLLKTTAIAVAPSVWKLEIANALIVAERKNRVTAENTAAFLNLLLRLNVITDSEADAAVWLRIVELARSSGLTAYDASYLELAMRMSVPIATKDTRLAKAAEASGVRLFPTSEEA